MNSYILGQRAVIETQFTDDDGVATDPSTITCHYASPSKAVTTLVYGTDGALVRDAAGAYHVNIDTDEFGVWDYDFKGTGVVVAIDQGQFKVLPLLVSA
jgi:hypothetical protein